MALRMINMCGPVHATYPPHHFDASEAGLPAPPNVTIETTNLPHTDAQFAFIVPTDRGDNEDFGLAKADLLAGMQNYQGQGFWYKWRTDGDTLEDGDVAGICLYAGSGAQAEHQSASGKYRINTNAGDTTGYDYSPDVWYKHLWMTDVAATRLKVYVNGSLAINNTNAAYTGGISMGNFYEPSAETTGDGDKCYSLYHIVDSDVEADILPDWFVEFEQHDSDSNSATHADGTDHAETGAEDFSYVDDLASGGSYSYGTGQCVHLLNAANQEQGFGITAAATTFRNDMAALIPIYIGKLNAASKTVDVNIGIYDGTNTDENGLHNAIPITTNADFVRGDVFVLQADGSTAWAQSAIANHEVVLFRDTDAAVVEVAAIAAWSVSYGDEDVPSVGGTSRRRLLAGVI